MRGRRAVEPFTSPNPTEAARTRVNRSDNSIAKAQTLGEERGNVGERSDRVTAPHPGEESRARFDRAAARLGIGLERGGVVDQAQRPFGLGQRDGAPHFGEKVDDLLPACGIQGLGRPGVERFRERGKMCGLGAPQPDQIDFPAGGLLLEHRAHPRVGLFEIGQALPQVLRAGQERIATGAPRVTA